MNLSTVKSIAIPEGNATSFSIGGVKVWSDNSGGGGEPAELLSWEGVAYHINKGTYKDMYAIGDMVPLDLGSEGLINMQIVAFDADTLADGSGKAPMTFISKELLKTKKRMNPALSETTEGTGAVGGWEKCEMRTYLNNAIKPMIPANATSLIKAVTKSQNSYDTAGESFTQTTNDEVWIPAYNEVYASGLLYREMFSVVSARKKSVVNSTKFTEWWLRDSTSQTNFRTITSSGGINYREASSTYAVCLGFCVGKTLT